MYPDGQEILVIDSEAPRRREAERVLSEEGFAVTGVAEGFSALRAADCRRYALVIAALELPGALDGTTTLRLIRARQPWIKALFTGGAVRHPDLPDRDRDEFIASPYERRELLGCVFELLQRGKPGRRGRAG